MICTETYQRLDFTRIRAILAEKCATRGGKDRALNLSPSLGSDIAKRRFDQTSEALEFTASLPFSYCTPADELLSELSNERFLSPRKFLQIAQVLEGINLIHKRIASGEGASSGGASSGGAFSGGASSGGGRFKLLKELAGQLRIFPELRQRILHTVDEDGVKESSFPHLAEIRRQLAAERKAVLRNLETFVAGSPDLFQESAIHFREGRLVLAVRRDRAASFEGVEHGLSGAGATVFMEPLELVPANNRLRRLREEEREETDRILLDLGQAVRDNAAGIQSSLETVGELDFIFARADWARRFKATAVNPRAGSTELRSAGSSELGSAGSSELGSAGSSELGSAGSSELVSAGSTELRKARHPLLELKRQVVPLDLKLDPGTRVLLVSGPNAGGKTVVIKTVGLIALMASCGLHIPAAADTSLPFFTKIFIDIGDEQSLDDDLSSFTAHLENLKTILAEADEDSLVLLDELGASTSPEEGGALGMAVLDALAERGATVIVTTHLESLKYFVEEREDMQNAGMEFDGHPTYRLIMGIPGASNALKIAGELGFPPPVLSRARDYVNPELLESSSLISKLTVQRKQVEQMRAELRETLAETAEARKRYERLEQEFTDRRKRFDDELLAERKKLLASSRVTFENLVREIRESDASRDAIKRSKQFIEAQEKLLTGESASPQESPAVLARLLPGMKVYSRTYKREGSVAEVGDNEALVELGSVKISLPLADLEIVDEDAKASPLHHMVDGEVPFNPRLRLLGLHADEAYDRLTGHIAEALALGVAEVDVVHGKGTGVLMSLVREFARSSKQVASFRVGEPHEGGDGVTVLRLST